MIALTLIFVGSILLLVNALLFKNVVIEYDEKHHFNVNGTLKEKDIRRQLEIEKFLNCEFVRVKWN